MAYKTKELKEKAIKAVKEHKLFFVEDIVAYLPCSRQAYYNHKLDKDEELKELLDQNKISTKVKLRKKWAESSNATLQMALMKLICTDEERKKLSMQYTEEEHSGHITITRKVITK